MENVIDWIILSLVLAIPVAAVVLYKRDARKRMGGLFKRHFGPAELQNLVVSERRFPYRVRVDLQRALDQIVNSTDKAGTFCGIPISLYQELSTSDLLNSRLRPQPPQFEEVDIGEEEPVRCLRTGLWLVGEGKSKYAVLLVPTFRCGDAQGIKIEIAAPKPQSTRLAKEFFTRLEEAVRTAASYRGKILSLEAVDSYLGQSWGILVHRLHSVSREQVILPSKTVELLDRNLIQFARQRPRLRQFRQSVKKGLLFYGPPGTGKTHTIHYLMSALIRSTRRRRVDRRACSNAGKLVLFYGELSQTMRCLSPCGSSLVSGTASLYNWSLKHPGLLRSSRSPLEERRI